MKIDYKSPSKFTKGVHSLWRGNDFNYMSSFFRQLLTRKRYPFEKKDDNEILFSSARSAIYSVLMSIGVEENDEVIVCSFTCDAVTHAVLRTGVKIVYVDINPDLSMNEQSITDAINDKTKAVIVQNTFGSSGVSSLYYSKLRKKNIFIIEDNCLSAGSKSLKKNLGCFGDVGIWSLEVSKSITIGWGGVLLINNMKYKNKIMDYCSQLKHVGIFEDTRRILQLWITLLLLKYKPLGGVIIWYFLYGTRLFKTSLKENSGLEKGGKKIGHFSSKFYYYMKKDLSDLYKKSNRNWKLLDKHLASLGFNGIIKESEGKYIISPRYSLLINDNNLSDVLSLSKDMKVELGEWFRDCPPSYKLEKCEVHSMSNAKTMSKTIINLPVYWTMSKSELHKIMEFMGIMAERGYLKESNY